MIRYPAYKVAAAHVAPAFLDSRRSVEKACSVIEEAAGGDEPAIQTAVPPRAGQPQSRPTNLGSRGEQREQPGLAAGCGRLLGDPDSPLCVLAAVPVVVALAVSVSLALLLFCVCLAAAVVLLQWERAGCAERPVPGDIREQTDLTRRINRKGGDDGR